MLPREFQLSVARIKAENGSIFGAGVRIGSNLVLTCAHVVEKALGPDGNRPVTLDFPWLRTPLFPARLLKKRPVVSGRALDIAVLEALEMPAQALLPPFLASREHLQHDFVAVGFSRGNDDGVWASGKMLAAIGDGQVQVTGVEVAGPFIEQGFSGTPVWDASVGAVVGIVASVKQQAELRTAFFVALADAVIGVPELAEAVSASELRTRAETEDRQRAEWQRMIRPLLAYPLPIPRVRDVIPYDVGVSPSRYVGDSGRPPPYVRRDVDTELRDALREHPFVVLVGPSKAGKSRTAFEAIRRVFPNGRLIVPDAAEPRVLERLDELTPSPLKEEGTVVWLDDLDRFLGSTGLDADRLKEWAAQPSPVRTVATIRSDARQRAKDAVQLGAGARQVFERAHSVVLPSTLTRAERATAAELYPGETFLGGIGETLAATRELLEKFDDGLAVCPLGHALVQAAVDWKRCGVTRPATKAELSRLTEVILRSKSPTIPLTEDRFEKALHWATEPLATHVALLTQVPEGPHSYVALDYIESRLEARRVPIEAEVWRLIIELCTPTEAVGVGIAAWVKGDRIYAGAALRKGIDAPERDQSIEAKKIYLLELGRQGKLEAAKALYEELKQDGADDDLMSTLNMAVALQNAGASQEATQLWELARRSPVPAIGATAGLNLADSLAVMGDLEGAVSCLEQARSLHSREVNPQIDLRLGQMFEKMNQFDSALEAYELASSSSDPAVSGEANIASARLLRKAGREDDFRQALERATRSAHAEHAAHALFLLAALRDEEGDPDGAEELFGEVIVSGSQEFANLARLWRGRLRLRLERREEAVADFERAAFPPSIAATAALTLAEIAWQDQDVERLTRALQAAVDAGDREQSPLAAMQYGDLLEQLDRPIDAATQYAVAAETGSEELSREAKSRLDRMVAEGIVAKDQVPLGTARPAWYDPLLDRAARHPDGSYVTHEMATADGGVLDVIVDFTGRPLVFPLNPEIWGLEPGSSRRGVFSPLPTGNVIVVLDESGRPTASRERVRKLGD